MRRQHLSQLLPIILIFYVSCGAAGDISDATDATATTTDAGTDAGTIADSGDSATDSAADFTPDGLAVVKYVTLANPNLDPEIIARFAMNNDDAIAADEPGCKTLAYDYDTSGPHTFCFNRSPNSRGIRYVTLTNSYGGQVLKLYEGTACHRQDVRAGHYEMKICDEGGEDSEPSATVFIGGTDIATAGDTVVTDDPNDDGSTYDYGADEADTVSPARFLNGGQQVTFLATNVCVHCDLKYADFSNGGAGTDFSIGGPIGSTDNTVAVLTNSDLTGADFTACDLTNATLNRAKFDDAIFDNATLVGANFTNASLQRASLNAAVLTGANLTSAHLEFTDLTNANLANANLTRARLDDSTLTTANMNTVNATRTRFNRALLGGATLTTATLAYAVFEGADLTNANLTGANLSYAKAGGATFTTTTLTGVNATYTYFNGSVMTSAIMGTMTLTGARFNSADLTNVVLTGSTFDILKKPVWKSTILTGATWTDGTPCVSSPSYYVASTAKCN